MNIITTCSTTGQWFDYHLRRFLWLAKKHMPGADYYLILVANPLTDKQDMLRKVKSHFKKVIFCDYAPMAGRLMFWEKLRAHSLKALNLKEGLYVDVDVDFVQSVEDIQYQYPDKEILWTPNHYYKNEVANALKACGLGTEVPFCDPGMLYMRAPQDDKFNAIVQLLYDNKSFANIEEWFVPGAAVWNVLMRTHQNAMALPYSYNVMHWVYDELKAAKSIHFGGDAGKTERLRIDTRTWPKALSIVLDGQVEPELRWDA